MSSTLAVFGIGINGWGMQRDPGYCVKFYRVPKFLGGCSGKPEYVAHWNSSPYPQLMACFSI
jgi:hypothetical protein